MKKQLLSLALLSAAWLTAGSARAWDEPTQVDGVYQLGSVNDVEWFSDHVQAGNTTIQAVLTADIDFGSEENLHNPIGRNDTYKFNGKFDGQGHRIKNMIINRPNDDYQGFFGILRGGGTQVKNLIIDGSCSITGKNRVGGISGAAHVHGSAESYIENCINEANITATNGYASGILGAMWDNTWPMYYMKNCVNAGDITGNPATAFIGNCGSSGITGAVSGNGNSSVVNCVNLGTLTTINGNNNLFGGTYRNLINSYDLVITGKQGEQVTWKTANPAASGELCYYLNGKVGGGTNFYQTIGDDPYPVPFNTSEPVYEVADYYCDGTPKGSVTYSNTDGGSRDPHVFDTTTGFCTVCGAINEEFVAVSADGFYHLSTPEQVEWFSHMVRDAGHGVMKVKLDNDIDFEGVPDAHLPIGSSAHKFFGHFDGQGHRIKGMVLTTASGLENRGYDGNGFFGSVRGGGTDSNGTVNNEVIIENLIIDASCSVTHDNNFAAGVVAHINSRNDENSNIIIRNCGNEANISSTGKNIAGILGCVEATNVGLKLYNLWNKGNITGSAESAAVCAWTGQRNVNGEVDVEGCWNIGEVTGVDGNGYNLIRRNSNIVPRNIIDLCLTNAGNQGKVSVLNTADPIASGELCYLLNGDQSTIVYTQNLGTDEMPVYRDATHSQVYQAGTMDCSGAAVGGISYNNVSGETIVLPHNINDEIGMCDVCYTQYQEPALVDDWYELKNAGNVEWYANYVNAAGASHKNAKLMNDIDFLSVENLHTSIGINTANKYNGTFDGQGFRIKNMIIERPTDSNIGFFGFLRGAGTTTIKNLIIDASCSIHAYNRVGGITGSYQVDGGIITIENVINEATITAEHQDAAGIIGGHEGGNPTIIIRNVLNTGTITAKNSAPYAGALCCYLGVGEGSKIENFVNLGTVNGHNGGNIGRHNIGDVTNIIDLSDTADKTQGIDSGLTQEDLATGKVAWYINSKDKQTADAFFQRLGTGGEAYPSPFGSAGVLYLGETGYTTMYDTKYNWSLNDGYQAYIGTVSGSAISLVGIDDVPAETAVVIKGTPNTYSNKEFVASTTTDVTGNELLGSDGTVTGGEGIYALSIKNNRVGFYPVASTVTIPAGKAYLDTNSDVKAFTFVFNDDATGIEMAGGQSSMVNEIYNLAGQRIQKMQKGINIVNGKKVLF